MNHTPAKRLRQPFIFWDRTTPRILPRYLCSTRVMKAKTWCYLQIISARMQSCIRGITDGSIGTTRRPGTNIVPNEKRFNNALNIQTEFLFFACEESQDFA